MNKLSDLAKMWLDKLHNFINATAHAELSAAVDRLAAYEDTGLTPEVCAEYKKFEDEVVARGGMTFGEWAALMHAEKARKAND